MYPDVVDSKRNTFKIQSMFPILKQEINGNPLIYLDNAATTQKPRKVIDALTAYYEQYNANIHRGIHTLAEKATQAFEQTRITAKGFINAQYEEEIIFVRGVTEAINLVASSYGRTFINEGDEILVSEMEHHSNIVPWQILCGERKAKLKVIPINDEGEILIDEYMAMLSKSTKLVAVNHVSNSLGTINPIKVITQHAHNVGAVVLIDGAQAGGHLRIDVQDIGCDFYCLSAHKMYGPTGVGMLYGKRAILEAMPPYQGGGEMISEVTFEKTTYNELPYKFEAGTPHIAGVIAFHYAMQFILEIGHDAIMAHDHELLTYATERICKLPSIKIIGTAKNKIGVLSFVIDGFHHFDIGHILDVRGIAVRTGQHCTHPLMQRLGIDGTARASFAIYNTKEEIDALVKGLRIINFIKA